MTIQFSLMGASVGAWPYVRGSWALSRERTTRPMSHYLVAARRSLSVTISVIGSSGDGSNPSCR